MTSASEIFAQFGPEYDVGSASLSKFRRKARKGLKALSYEERRAYGAAVEAAVLRSQRPARREVDFRPSCASGSWANRRGEVGEAVRRQQNCALLAYPTQVRRNRTPREWKELYAEAMKEKRRRKKSDAEVKEVVDAFTKKKKRR